VAAEESETPGGEQGRGGPSEGPGFGGLGRRTEGDLLAERRARRAAESGKDALIQRAEIAEATMQTLQAHVASLQERLGEAEQERRRLAEQLAARRAAEPPEQWPAHGSGTGERELRLAMQREYAEQQLRADAEQRLRDLEGMSRAEIDRLGRRLADSERHAQGLAQELDGVRRQLAGAEQAAAGERAALRLAERDLKGRLAEVERRTVEVNRGLDAERKARERSERMLESMSRGHRLMQGVVGELRDLVARLAAAVAVEARARAAQAPASQVSFSTRPAPHVAGDQQADAAARDDSPQPGEEMAEALADAVARLRARAVEAAPASAQRGASHKHSMSLLGRWRGAFRRRRQP
jgi:hypothetical protein